MNDWVKHWTLFPLEAWLRHCGSTYCSFLSFHRRLRKLVDGKISLGAELLLAVSTLEPCCSLIVVLLDFFINCILSCCKIVWISTWEELLTTLNALSHLSAHQVGFWPILIDLVGVLRGLNQSPRMRCASLDLPRVLNSGRHKVSSTLSIELLLTFL